MGEAKYRQDKMVALSLPVTWEIFEAQDRVGGFVQLAAHIQSEAEAKAAFANFRSHPDFLNSGRKLFLVRVTRDAIVANFDPGELKPLGTAETKQ